MRIFICFIVGFFVIASSFAQDWHTNFSEAKTLAANQNKPIILVFQGSDWCAPCIKLDRQIWSSSEFRDYSKDHFIMLKADFPRKSKNALSQEQEDHNKRLAEKYNSNGFFPYVVVLDETGQVKGTTGYKNVTPSEYIEILESFLK